MSSLNKQYVYINAYILVYYIYLRHIDMFQNSLYITFIYTSKEKYTLHLNKETKDSELFKFFKVNLNGFAARRETVRNHNTDLFSIVSTAASMSISRVRRPVCLIKYRTCYKRRMHKCHSTLKSCVEFCKKRIIYIKKNKNI